MRLLSLFPGILSCLLSFSQENQTAFFEGHIDYKTEYRSIMQGVSDNEISTRLGNQLRIYFSENHLKWVFSDELDYVRSYVITDISNNTEYSWSDDNPDTIYLFDITRERRIRTDSIAENGMKKVLDCDCRVVSFWTTHFFENMDISQPVTSQYYFCPGYPINPDPYRNVKEMNWGEVIARYRGVALRIDTQFEYAFSAIFLATRVTPGKPDKSLFAIDGSKIIKHTFAE